MSNHYTAVFEVNDEDDALSLRAPLVAPVDPESRLTFIVGTDGNLVDRHRAFRDAIHEAWNQLPAELRTSQTLRPLLEAIGSH